MSRRKSTKKLRERGNGFKNVKPRRRMNAKKAGPTDRGRGRVRGISIGGWS